MPRLQLLTLKYAIEAHPQSPPILIALADHYFNTDNKTAGIDHLVTAFKIAPTYPDLARRLGTYGLRVDIPQPIIDLPIIHE